VAQFGINLASFDGIAATAVSAVANTLGVDLEERYRVVDIFEQGVDNKGGTVPAYHIIIISLTILLLSESSESVIK
jgi:hypothetical protein